MDNIDIKEEVYRCSKCGLCRGVCPIFLATKNELFLPRGRYIVLNNFFNNNKIFSRKFIQGLDICLNCNECKNFCPSNINSSKIFTLLKNKYDKKFIPFYLKYFFILILHSIKKIFSNSQLYKLNVKRNKKNKTQETEVVYFQGCFNKYINSSDKNAAINLLEENGYKVIKISDKCCGLPYLSDGNIEKYKKNIQNIIKSIPQKTKYVVTSCDSCFNTLYDEIKNTEIKLVKIDELIKFSKNDNNAVYHKPYSREKYSGNIPTINRKGACTLMENFFYLKHKKTADKILNKVFYKKEEIDGKIILTSCNITKWGLINACEKQNIKAEIYSLSEFENKK